MIPGKNIYLRPVSVKDVNFILEWENDPDLWEVTSTPGPFTKGEIIDFIKSSTNVFEQKQMRWMICLKDFDTPIGALDLFEYSSIKKSAGIGILIGDKSMRGKGLAGESLTSFIEYTFATLPIDKLYCMVHMDNIASLRIFEKNNFTKTGVRYFRNKKAVKMELIKP
ncbi:MAG: GNAT family N-acetyltransferase [Flavobacteriales bacterium]|jgi:diamine N-acetyltransferase